MLRKRRTLYLLQADEEIDLVPLIDCVFLILLFFMLCGQLTTNDRVEQISVPPAKTAKKIELDQPWRHEVLNIGGGPVSAPVRIRCGTVFDSAGLSEVEGHQRLRRLLDQLYDSSPTDPRSAHADRPAVVIELRADSDVPWRTMQTVQQLLADSIDPLTGLPSTSNNRKSFTELLFSTRASDGSQ
jgi:biopolymer transport protein ExbD